MELHVPHHAPCALSLYALYLCRYDLSRTTGSGTGRANLRVSFSPHVAGQGTRSGSFIPGHSSNHPVPMSDLNKPIGNRHVGIPVSMAWGPPAVSRTPSGLAKSQCPELRGYCAVSFAGRERGMRRLSPKLSRVTIRRCFRRRAPATARGTDRSFFRCKTHTKEKCVG